MSTTQTRVLSALVLAPLVIGIIQYGSVWLFAALILATGWKSWWEYAVLMEGMGIPGFPKTGAMLTLAFLLLTFWASQTMGSTPWIFVIFFVFFLPLFSFLFIFWMPSGRDVREGVDDIAYSMLGVFYVGPLMGSFLLIRQFPEGNLWIYFLFLVIWSGDSAAYFVGRAIGKRPLAPKISPGKTLEGGIANTLGAVAGGVIAKLWFLEALPMTHCLLVAFVCGIIGQVGDLFESFLKRAAGAKDSGTLIPGHGGVLDRLDSLMFTGPVLVIYLFLTQADFVF